MNIQGLEALATLASAVPAPGATDPSDATTSNTSTVQQESTGTNTAIHQDGSQQMNVSQTSQSQGSTQQNSQQAQMMSQQQMWQQLMASTAGSTHNGSQQPNPAMVAGTNALGQMGSFFGNPPNMNIQRLTAQPQLTATPAAPVAAPVPQPPAVDPTVQALSMALNGMNPALLSSLFGTYILPYSFPSSPGDRHAPQLRLGPSSWH